jgi:2'-5' RNA ligase
VALFQATVNELFAGPKAEEAKLRGQAIAHVFEVRLQEAGAFPAGNNPRVLWLGLQDETRRLAEFHERLEAEGAGENFPRETRAFHPHLTIARIRIPNTAPARHLAKLHRETEFEPATFNVNELIIMQSQLGAGGSRYTPLARYELKERAGP